MRLLVKLKSLKFSSPVQFTLSLSDCASFQAFETGKVAKLCLYCGFTRYDSYFACTLISKRFKIRLPVTAGNFLKEVNCNMRQAMGKITSELTIEKHKQKIQLQLRECLLLWKGSFETSSAHFTLLFFVALAAFYCIFTFGS